MIQPIRSAAFTFSLRCVLVPALLIGTGRAQNAPESGRSFEVASVRITAPSSRIDDNLQSSDPEMFPGNRFVMAHTLLKRLIAEAWGVPVDDVLDVPDWADSVHYDISAKAAGNADLTEKEMRPMLQELLKERLHLAVHSDPKVMDGYALVVAEGGPKIMPNKGAPAFGAASRWEYRFQNASMEQLVISLSYGVGRPIVDKTRLTGMFDFDLRFAPANAGVGSTGSNYPPLLRAVEEQLGLRLVAGEKVRVNYLVVDHVDKKPTAE